MDANLKDIIKEIGKDYKISEEKINKCIEILSDEFYIKLKDIKNISENEWKSLNLPMNLYHIIKEKYDSTKREEKNNSFFSKSINNIDFDPIVQFVSSQKREEVVFENLSLLFQEVNNDEIMGKILKQIYKIIANIIQNPNNEKYKCFNINKFLSKYKFPTIETFFLDIEFKRKNEYMHFMGNYNNIKKVMSEFIKFIKDNKIGNVIDNDLDSNFDKKIDNDLCNNLDKKINNNLYNKSDKKIENNLETQINKKMTPRNSTKKDKDNESDNEIIINIDNQSDNKKDNSMEYNLDNQINDKKENKVNNIIENSIDNSIDKLSAVQHENLSSSLDNQENKILNGSTLIDNSSNIKLYLYPKITFSTEEEKNSKVILLIGQTGEGKTTFLNALVNIYSGIKIEDNFRYLLVQDQNISDQTKSKTKEVTIYYIKPSKELNYPPLKIVDTPGFGDTGGIDEDKNHLKKLKKVFDENLIVVHSICFIVNCYKYRIDFHQEYVFNTLMSLFAEDVKNNFIVGVTHFFHKSNKEIPSIIKHYLSLENSFYYKCILEEVDIQNSYWYFACDNEIISDNTIEKNLIEKCTWEQTEETIKFYIENKIKDSQGKKIIESKEVLEKRISVLNQVDILEKKLKELIETRKIYENNKRKKHAYLEEISNKEEIIQKHKKTKEELEIFL